MDNNAFDSISYVKDNKINYAKINGSNPLVYVHDRIGGQTAIDIHWNEVLPSLEKSAALPSLEKWPEGKRVWAVWEVESLINSCVDKQELMNSIWVSYRDENTRVFSGENFKEIPGLYVSRLPFIGVHNLSISAESLYINDVCRLPNVKAILYEKEYNVNKYITILNERNIETRNEIYKTEMKLFELFENEHFEFQTKYYNDADDFEIIFKGKKILYYNNIP